MEKATRHLFCGRVGHVMQALGRRYVGYVNDRYRRTGTLGEGRYGSCPAASDEHLLHCHRCIEPNPARAAMATGPAEHPDSSYRTNALGRTDSQMTMHAQDYALGAMPDLRQDDFREFVGRAVSDDQLDLIRQRLSTDTRWARPVPGDDRRRNRRERPRRRRWGGRRERQSRPIRAKFDSDPCFSLEILREQPLHHLPVDLHGRIIAVEPCALSPTTPPR